MPLVTNQEINTGFVNACLSVVNVAGSALMHLKGENDTEKATEAELALEVTVMGACDRLDKILADEARWTLPKNDGHQNYVSIAEQQALNLSLGNDLKGHEVFAAEFNKQLAVARLLDPSTFSQETGIPPAHKSCKTKNSGPSKKSKSSKQAALPKTSPKS